jgi:hypothetical protein
VGSEMCIRDRCCDVRRSDETIGTASLRESRMGE